MKKLLILTVLASSASISLPAYSALEADSTEVPAVIVSAARTEQSTLTTPASMTVITREQIKRSGASHIVDVLRGQGGVHVNDLFGDGSRASIGMRGFGDATNSNTLVLIDGRRLNNPDIASPDLNGIALADVERIEIVQGSAGVLFGDQAVGGVINIITSKPGALRHSLQFSTGSYTTANFHGMTTQALDNGINYRVSLDLSESDNYRVNNDASYVNGFGNLGYDFSHGSVFIETQYIDDELKTSGTLFDDEVAANRKQVSPNFSTDFSNAKTKTTRIGLVREINNDWAFEGELTQRKTDGIFRLSSVFGAETENATQSRRVREFTPRFIGQLPQLKNTIFTFGLDVIESDYMLSSRFGDQLNNQEQRSVYIQSVISVSDKIDVTSGIRHASVDNDLRDVSAFALFPAGIQIEDDGTVATLGLAIKADENWRVFFRADENYRFAKVDEFLAPALTPTFTPIILKTQTGLSFETGIEWKQGSNSAKLIVYKLDLENEIAFDPINFANINIEDTQRKGFIASGNWGITEQSGMTVSYTYTDAEVSRGAFAGKEVPFVAKQSLLLSSHYALSDTWNFNGELYAIDERVFSGDFDNVLDKLPGYAVVNIKAEYKVNNFTLSGRINNVFDKEYSDVGQLGSDPVTFASRDAYFPSPEMNFLLTAAWDFR